MHQAWFVLGEAIFAVTDHFLIFRVPWHSFQEELYVALVN